MIILIPSYEPTAQLPELVAQLAAAFEQSNDRVSRILIVDDGSGERYRRVFEDASLAGAEIVRHTKNRGKGAALRTGFKHIQVAFPGQIIVTADGDGQHTVADILRVAARAEQTNVEAGSTVILGCRSFTGAVPARSRFGNSCSRAMFRVAAGWQLSDTQTGLRGFRPEMIPWLLSIRGERFEYEQRVLLTLRRAGYMAREQPIETVYLDNNTSSHFRPLVDSIRVFAPILLFSLSSFFAFCIDAGVLFVCYWLTGALVPSVVLARVTSASVNFIVNRRLVFMQRGRAGALRQAISYSFLAIVLLLSNIVWMEYLTSLGIPLWGAKGITELVLFFTSYHVQRQGVFRPAPAGPSQTAFKGSLSFPDRMRVQSTQSQLTHPRFGPGTNISGVSLDHE